MCGFIDYKRNRSAFWVRIYHCDNPENVTILTKNWIASLINMKFPKLVSCSPTGWRISKGDASNSVLWIPANKMNDIYYQPFVGWLQKANEFIWLQPNKNIAKYFDGNEVDYCIAADWSYDMTTCPPSPTPLGEAESKMKYKYKKGEIGDDDANRYMKLLMNAIHNCLDVFSPCWTGFVVTTIPAICEKQDKLAWKLARDIANDIECDFVPATLLYDKQQTKKLPVDEKRRIWNKIFTDNDIQISKKMIKGKNVLIIDDLYQSGTSMWCYAKYLKDTHGAQFIIAVSPVKACRDDDNT